MAVTIKAYSDGSCELTSKKMHIGIYAERCDTGEVICYGHSDVRNREGDILPGTCNESEFYALLELLSRLDTYLKSHTAEEHTVLIHTDSMLAYRQIKGDWKIKSDTLFYLVGRVRSALENGPYKLVHIPRKENRMADSLSNEGCTEDPHFGMRTEAGRGRDEAADGDRNLSTDFLSQLFPKNLPSLRNKLVSAVEGTDTESAITALDEMVFTLGHAAQTKTTQYMDTLIQRVVGGILSDLKHTRSLILGHNFEEALNLLEAYKFLPTETTEIFENPNSDEFEDIELCEAR